MNRTETRIGFVIALLVGTGVAVGLAAALFAIWAIFRMRAVYYTSLLNWRLKRRQRGGSVLDRLDFGS